MSIFLALAKRVIIDKANAICRASSDADISLSTQAMRLFAPSVRNDELSARKRQLITTSLRQLDTLEESQTDEKSFAQMIVMIKSWVRQEEAISTEFGYARGETETGLENLEALLQAIFDKLSEVGLINIPISSDPLYIVRNSFAEYFTATITLLRDQSILVRATLNPLISSKITFATAQQALVTESLQQCLRHMDLLNNVRSHPLYLTNTKEIILFILKSLKDKNEALRLSHSKGMIPGVSAIIQVDNGILDRCLQVAEAEIIGPLAPRLQTMAFDAFSDGEGDDYAELATAELTRRPYLAATSDEHALRRCEDASSLTRLAVESAASASAGDALPLLTEFKAASSAEPAQATGKARKKATADVAAAAKPGAAGSTALRT